MPFLACMEALIRAAAAAIRKVSLSYRQDRLIHVPAAAAGSAAKALGPTFSAAPGLIDFVGASGLLVLRVSDSLRDGDRDRRSKRDERFGSGSVWSNRDRLELLRSSSAILLVV